MSAPCACRRRRLASREEWQFAVDVAYGALALNDARRLELVSGGPEVNVPVCETILAAASKRGISPSGDAIERFLAQFERDLARLDGHVSKREGAA